METVPYPGQQGLLNTKYKTHENNFVSPVFLDSLFCSLPTLALLKAVELFTPKKDRCIKKRPLYKNPPVYTMRNTTPPYAIRMRRLAASACGLVVRVRMTGAQ